MQDCIAFLNKNDAAYSGRIFIFNIVRQNARGNDYNFHDRIIHILLMRLNLTVHVKFMILLLLSCPLVNKILMICFIKSHEY